MRGPSSISSAGISHSSSSMCRAACGAMGSSTEGAAGMAETSVSFAAGLTCAHGEGSDAVFNVYSH